MNMLDQAIANAQKLNESFRHLQAGAQAKLREKNFGSINPALVCPHCQAKGQVRTKRVTQKQGVSGGKATAAVLTAGFSLLATGLSRKVEVTQAVCDSCHSIWTY